MNKGSSPPEQGSPVVPNLSGLYRCGQQPPAHQLSGTELEDAVLKWKAAGMTSQSSGFFGSRVMGKVSLVGREECQAH